jgi:hypothetical protein
LAKNHDDLVASVRWAARDRFSAEVNAPDWVTMELTQQHKELLLLHLVNYKPAESVSDIRVTIRPPGKTRVREVTLATPENVAGESLRFETTSDGIAIAIPFMRVYALLIMSLEQA